MIGRTLVIAAQPGPRGGRTKPMQPDLPDSPGDRLRRRLGLSKREFKRQFELINLISSRCRRWNSRMAANVASSLLQLLRDRTCLLIGQSVCNAFGVGQLEWLDGVWVDVLQSGRRVRLVPVPLLTSTWWDKDSALHRFRAAMVREDVIT